MKVTPLSNGSKMATSPCNLGKCRVMLTKCREAASLSRLPALLSHAAKIPGTESYHPDRSEVGFGYGLPGHLSACPPDWPNDGGGPPPDPAGAIQPPGRVGLRPRGRL